MVAAKGADDEAVFLQSEEDGVTIADFDHDKVGGAGDEAEFEFF